MKLLLSADTITGAWTYAVDLCTAFADRNIEVALATMGAPLTDIQRQQVRALPNVRLVESHYRLEWMDDPWNDIRAARGWLLHVRDKFAPDVVHLNSYTLGALDWGCPLLIAAHSCVQSWWEAVRGEPAPHTWDRYRHDATIGIQAADLVVAPSQIMLRSLRGHYAPLKAARVIYLGRDPLLYGAAPKESFVFSAGRLWDEAKNLRALEGAASRIVWPVLVAGDGLHPDSGPCAEVTRVRFIGKLSPRELAMVFARASIYALPATYEPCGLSILEAAMSGCALVLGDIPSLHEIWGNAATYVDPMDSTSLAYAVNQLIEDHAMLIELAHRAQRRAMHYSVSRMADEYADAYCQLRNLAASPAANSAEISSPWSNSPLESR